MVQTGSERREAEYVSEHVLSPLGFDPNKAIVMATAIVKEHPHAALAGAFGIGFLLGGGLTPRLVGAIALIVARRYLSVAVDEALSSLQQTLVPHDGQSVS